MQSPELELRARQWPISTLLDKFGLETEDMEPCGTGQTREELMRATIIIAVALLAVACSKKQAAPKAPATPNIQSEEVTYKAGDTTLQGYVAWDANKEGPQAWRSRRAPVVGAQ